MEMCKEGGEHFRHNILYWSQNALLQGQWTGAQLPTVKLRNALFSSGPDGLLQGDIITTQAHISRRACTLLKPPQPKWPPAENCNLTPGGCPGWHRSQLTFLFLLFCWKVGIKSKWEKIDNGQELGPRSMVAAGSKFCVQMTANGYNQLAWLSILPSC